MSTLNIDNFFSNEFPFQYPAILDPDRTVTIGSEKYTFYCPIQVSEQYIVSIWTRKYLQSQQSEEKYSVSIYVYGNLINSTRNIPVEWRNQPWANKLGNSWKEEVMSEEEVEDILAFLVNISKSEQTDDNNTNNNNKNNINQATRTRKTV